jgi:hypothetical protein
MTPDYHNPGSPGFGIALADIPTRSMFLIEELSDSWEECRRDVFPLAPGMYPVLGFSSDVPGTVVNGVGGVIVHSRSVGR